MKTAQDRSGRFDLHDPQDGDRRGPSWLTVQILAALCGLLLVASILLPIAMGVRMRNAARATDELAEQLTSEIERSATLERDNRELRTSGGQPELLAEVKALREERDRLQDQAEAAAAAPAVKPGPDPSTAPSALPLRRLIEEAGSIQLVPRLNDDASKMGIAAGPIGFAAQQRLASEIPNVQIVASAPTQVAIDVVCIPYGGGSADQGGIVIVTLSLTQNWRLDEQTVATVSLWSSSSADNSTGPQAVKTVETLTTTLLNRLVAAIGSP